MEADLYLRARIQLKHIVHSQMKFWGHRVAQKFERDLSMNDLTLSILSKKRLSLLSSDVPFILFQPTISAVCGSLPFFLHPNCTSLWVICSK